MARPRPEKCFYGSGCKWHHPCYSKIGHQTEEKRRSFSISRHCCGTKLSWGRMSCLSIGSCKENPKTTSAARRECLIWKTKCSSYWNSEFLLAWYVNYQPISVYQYGPNCVWEFRIHVMIANKYNHGPQKWLDSSKYKYSSQYFHFPFILSILPLPFMFY